MLLWGQNSRFAGADSEHALERNVSQQEAPVPIMVTLRDYMGLQRSLPFFLVHLPSSTLLALEWKDMH